MKIRRDAGRLQSKVCFKPQRPTILQSNSDGPNSWELKRTCDLNECCLLNVTCTSACSDTLPLRSCSTGRSLQSLRRRGRHILQEGRAGSSRDCLRNPRDLVKNRIAVERHNCENFSEKVNQFNAVSSGFPTIETTIKINDSSGHNSSEKWRRMRFWIQGWEYDVKQTFFWRDAGLAKSEIENLVEKSGESLRGCHARSALRANGRGEQYQ
jgi:hypothetical protein